MHENHFTLFHFEWNATSLFLSTLEGFKKSRVLLTGDSPVDMTCK